MADRYRHRVRRVIRLGNVGQVQNGLDHQLHLSFFCAPIARHRLLDLQGRVFKDLAVLPVCRHDAHTTRLRHVNRRFGVVIKKQFLKRHLVWREALHQLAHALEQNVQPFRHPHLRRRINRPIVDELHGKAIVFDDAVPHDGNARVNS